MDIKGVTPVPRTNPGHEGCRCPFFTGDDNPSTSYLYATYLLTCLDNVFLVLLIESSRNPFKILLDTFYRIMDHTPFM